jgi:hypothetical protein
MERLNPLLIKKAKEEISYSLEKDRIDNEQNDLPEKKSRNYEKNSLILKAMQNGKQAARYGSVKPSIELLVFKKGYSMDEAHAYIDSYNKAAGSDEEQRLRRAKRAGAQAALMGFNCPSYHQLIRKGYGDEDIKAYFSVFKRVAGTEQQQKERRIKLSGYQAAKYGCRRPNENKLKNKGYNEEEMKIYYEAYDNAVGESEEQLVRKVKREAYQMARLKVTRPNESYLLKRGLNESLIDLFYSIFDKTTELLFLNKY